VRRASVVGLVVFIGLIGAYFIALNSEIRRVNEFCEEMKPGLDVHRIASIATKYDVGFLAVRDPKSVDLRNLGVKDSKNDNIWFFGVAAPMTMGDHACGVYHDYHVVTKSWLSPE
jgi:hypothetical protein